MNYIEWWDFQQKSYSHIISSCANKNGQIFIFQAEERQQIWHNGQTVREMDCILLRDGINKRITAMQNHSLDILIGLVWILSRIIILVHVLVELPVFVTETWLYTFYDQIREIADCGVQLFCSGFSPLRKWTFWGWL